MSQKSDNHDSSLEILMGLAGFRCTFCNSTLQGDLFCSKCRVGHCPCCGEPAVRLDLDPETWKRNTCHKHVVALDAARWKGGRKGDYGRRGRGRTGGRERMILVADVPEPTVRMDTEPFRSRGLHADVREFFGGFAPLLDALNPSGWADRAIFADRLLKVCGTRFIRLVFPPQGGDRGVGCYFAKNRRAAERELERTAERFEERVDLWFSGNGLKKLPAGRVATI